VWWLEYAWLALSWGFIAGCAAEIIKDVWTHRNDKKNEGG
jgi:hypothetical protein